MEIRSYINKLSLRLTILLTLIVAVLSVITGIINIGTQTLVGPIAVFIPPKIQETAGFTGTLTGFLIVTSALGLRRKLRIAWYSTVLLLPVTALQGVLQSSPLSVPLILLSIIALINLIANKKNFDRSLSLSTAQLGAATAIISAQAYGTVGTYTLRDQFVNVDTLIDAFYYTLVTASTVGYGDLTATTQMARLFSMSVVILGTSSFAIALGTLLGPIIQERFSKALGKMTETQLDLLEDHIIVLGYGELTDIIIEELEGKAEYIIITPNTDQASKMREKKINVLVADPTDESSLHKSQIEDAKAVIISTNYDKKDALSILTVRELNSTIPILATVTKRENIKKLKRAGADIVVSPASIGGKLTVKSALEGEEKEIDEIVKDISID